MTERKAPDTPYRKGRRAGREFWEARAAYLAAGGHKSGNPAPALPENPYDFRDQRRAWRNFKQGVDDVRAVPLIMR